jgi:hypothetical protein
MDELTKMNIFTTPVMKINGETIVGFDKVRVDAVLERMKKP